jgi:2-polyprenyl-3-methyl-5-hydroxy-6-metoxy-1,4-benzoquinol methylase
MSTGFLAARDDDARELMDDPDCDPVALARTYARFAAVNAIVSGQRAVYRRWIRPRLRPDRIARLLDVGTGGADFPRRVLAWARDDGLGLEVVAIDPDPRAIEFARRLEPVAGLSLRETSTSALRAAGERFDVVASNHVLHHLSASEVHALLGDCEQLIDGNGVAVHGDIERSRLGYAAFAAATWPFESNLLRGTFIRADGLTSIRRSRTAGELTAIAPSGWLVRRAFPSRLEVVWERS